MAISDALSLLFRIKADGSDARKEVASTSNAITKEVGALRGGFKEVFTQINQDVAASTGRFGQLASAFGPVGLGLAAVTGGALLAGAGVLKLADHASTAGSELNDLSLKTGLSVETLSGLRLELIQSGSSVEALSDAVFDMQRRVTDAAEGNEQLRRAFARVGVRDFNAAITDTEGTLRAVLKGLGDVTDAGERNALGAELLGKKYKQLSVFVAETGGDINAVIERAREAGLVMSTEAAAAADRYGDAIDALRLRVSAAVTSIGSRLIPELIVAIDDVDGALARNSDSWASWGETVGGILAATRAYVEGVALSLRTMNFSGGLAFIEEQGKQYRQRAAEREGHFDLTRPFTAETVAAGRAVLNKKLAAFGGGARLSGGGGGGGGKGGGGGADKELNERLRALELQVRAADQLYREETQSAQRAYDKRLTSLRDYSVEAITAEQTRLASVVTILDKEIAEVEKRGKDKENKLAELRQRRQDEERKAEENILRIRDEVEQKELESAREYAEGLVRIEEAGDANRIARRRQYAEENVFEAGRMEEEIAAIELEAHMRRVNLLREQQQAAGANAEERRRIGLELGRMEVELTGLMEEQARRQIEVGRRVREELERQKQSAEDLLRSWKDYRNATMLDNPASNLSLFGGGSQGEDDAIAESQSTWEAATTSAQGILGELSASAGNLRTIMSDAFGGIAQGFGGMIQAFLVGGDISIKAFAKMAKGVIAGVAAQAAVKAIFELAEGLAALAKPWTAWQAPFHFAASKTYGIVAGVAAGIALAIPGGGAASAGGAIAGGATSNPYAEHEDRRTRFNREQSEADRFTSRENRRGAAQPLVIQLVAEGRKLAEVVLDDIRRGGDNRDGFKHALT